MIRSRQQGMGLRGIVAVIAVVAALLYMARGLLDAPPPKRVATGAPGVAYIGERDDDPVLVRWDGRKGSAAGPAPPLELRMRHTDKYGWWFGDPPHRLKSDDPQGPEELHLSLVAPSADSFPAAMFDPICEPSKTPFELCRDGLVRLIVHRPVFHTEAETVLTGTKAPRINESLPFDQRPTQALMEFWTTAEPDGYRHVAGWVCPDGLRIELNTPAPLAVLAAASAPDPKLACFKPPKWWQRAAPGRFGFERHAVYFRCEPKAPCKADFFYEARNVEMLEEHPNLKPAPWHSLAMLVAAWETLERMRMDAIRDPDPAAQFDEARVLLQTCGALVAEGQRWMRNGSLADDPTTSFRPSTAWRNRSLPCQQVASIATRLMALEPKRAEPLLKQVIGQLESIDDSGARPLYEIWLAGLEKAGKGTSPEMLEAFVRALHTMEGYSEYDKDQKRKARRIEQAWALAQSVDPPASFDTIGKIARAAAASKHYVSDAAGAFEIYRQWNELAKARGASPLEQLDSLEAMTSEVWQQGNFAAFRTLIDQVRDAYFAASAAGLALGESRERLARTAFYVVFEYRCYAVHERSFDMAREIAPVVSRMESDFGPDSQWVKAAHFHQTEVVTRRAAPEGTPIGGGFLGS